MAPALRRALTVTAVVVVFLLLVGTTYQGVATALERRRYPHPGRMVKAGRHQLHIYCTGEGTPTVVLEAPATGMSSSWGWVQDALTAHTRVCSYDRAGLGWSEWGTTAFNPDAVPIQLHTLLANAGEPAPYVLVGEGFGAALARMTAARYPQDTAGLVLIDPPAAETASAMQEMARSATLSPWLARTGLLRLTRVVSGTPVDLPEPAGGSLKTFLARPDHLTRSARELAAWNETVARGASADVPSTIPTATVRVMGDSREAMLTRRADADTATEAVLRMVNGLRQRP
jgi:pimeloyl-ACP methyl ester carboxylesterase